MVFSCLTSHEANGCSEILCCVFICLVCHWFPSICCQTIANRENSISTHNQLFSYFGSRTFVTTSEATSMHEHDSWSMLSLVAIRGQVSIKHEILLLLSQSVKGWTVLDILDHLNLVFRKDRVNEAAGAVIGFFSASFLFSCHFYHVFLFFLFCLFCLCLFLSKFLRERRE